jgi:hypothetical protein
MATFPFLLSIHLQPLSGVASSAIKMVDTHSFEMATFTKLLGFTCQKVIIKTSIQFPVASRFMNYIFSEPFGQSEQHKH